MCKWRVTLPPTTDIGPYVITAKSQKYGNISLSDVLFGDVWICSGQSNMQFTVPQVNVAVGPMPRAFIQELWDELCIILYGQSVLSPRLASVQQLL